MPKPKNILVMQANSCSDKQRNIYKKKKEKGIEREREQEKADKPHIPINGTNIGIKHFLWGTTQPLSAAL